MTKEILIKPQTSLPDRSLGLYVINLDRSAGRWEKISRGLAALPWPLTRVSAYDAKENPAAVLKRRGHHIVHQPDGVGWNPLRYRMFTLVEEACFCSHLAALEKFLATGQTHALIFEDDAEPRRAPHDELQALLQCVIPYDIVKLEGIRHSGARLALEECRFAEAALVRSMRPNSGAAAYLVTRAGARRLIEHAGKQLFPFDDYLNNPGLHGGIVRHLSPWLFWQAGGESTMGVDRKRGSAARKRDPWHFLVQFSRRAVLRFKLWRSALMRPHISFSWRRAPW